MRVLVISGCMGLRDAAAATAHPSLHFGTLFMTEFPQDETYTADRISAMLSCRHSCGSRGTGVSIVEGAAMKRLYWVVAGGNVL